MKICLWLLIGLVVLWGCSGTESSNIEDEGADAALDGSADAERDVGADSETDASVDDAGAPDAHSVADASRDVSVDSGSVRDAAPDLGSDLGVGNDSALDAAPLPDAARIEDAGSVDGGSPDA